MQKYTVDIIKSGHSFKKLKQLDTYVDYFEIKLQIVANRSFGISFQNLTDYSVRIIIYFFLPYTYCFNNKVNILIK